MSQFYYLIFHYSFRSNHIHHSTQPESGGRKPNQSSSITGFIQIIAEACGLHFYQLATTLVRIYYIAVLSPLLCHRTALQ